MLRWTSMFTCSLGRTKGTDSPAYDTSGRLEPFRFTGEQRDGESSFVFPPARYD